MASASSSIRRRAGSTSSISPGTEAAAADDLGSRQRDRPGLRCGDDQPIAGDRERGGTKAVAVDHRADPSTVGEDDRGGSVPGSEEARRSPAQSRDRRVLAAPHRHRLGDRGEESDREVPAGRDEQLDRLVEGQGVRSVRGKEWPGLEDRAEEAVRVAVGRAPPDLLPVATDRVDLAVVGDEPERLGESPDRSRVRRVALVEEGVARRQAGRAGLEVGEEPGKAPSRDEALVDDRVPRRRGDRQVGDPPFPRSALDATTGPEDAEIHVGVGGPAGSPGVIRPHDGLDEGRPRRRGLPPECGWIARHGPPSSDGKALGLERRLHQVSGPCLGCSTGREEQLEDRRSVARSDRGIRADPGPEGRLEREGDAGAIGRLTVGGERAAVAERGKAGQGEGEDPGRGSTAGIGDEADATGIVLVARVVERWIRGDPSALHRGVETPPAHSLDPCAQRVGVARRVRDVEHRPRGAVGRRRPRTGKGAIGSRLRV